MARAAFRTVLSHFSLRCAVASTVFSALLRIPAVVSVLPAGLVRILDPVCLLAAVLCSAGALYFFDIGSRKQAAELVRIQEKLIDTELKNLNRGIAEFALGDLSVHIADPAVEPVKTDSFFALADIAAQVNRLQACIVEGIADFNTITYEPCSRICYVGTDNYLEGEKCGEILGGMLGGSGEVAIILNSLDKVNHRLRKKGFANVMALKFPGITIVDILETLQVPETTYRKTLELLSSRPNLKGIYVDEASTPHAAMQALTERNLAGRIRVVAHDVTENSMPFIRSGQLSTLSQNPYSQGFDPVVLIYNYLVSHEKLIIDRILPKTDEFELIDRDSLPQFWDDRKGRILSEKARAGLGVPKPNPSGKPLRISVLIPNDAGFFKQVGDGARDAERVLASFGVSVRIVVPEEMKKGDVSAATTRRYIDREVADGATGIVTPIFEKELVGYVNELHAKGVAVATFNSEPIGLRAMLNSVFGNINFIFGSSETLAANSKESMEATKQINATMKTIVGSTAAQLGKLAETEGYIQSLLEDVESATTRSTESLGTADRTNEFAGIGQSKVVETNAAFKLIQGNYRATAGILQTLNKNSRKVQAIVGLLEELAAQTNLIAINVSILAARAGKGGAAFAVVANDIRSLAERSALGAVDINVLINLTLQNIDEVTSLITKDMSEINTVTQRASETEHALNDIITASADNKDKVHHVIDLISDMKGLSMSIRSSMKELDDINRQNTEAIGEIDTATYEVSQQVTDNAAVSQLLCDMARSQKDLLSQYFN